MKDTSTGKTRGVIETFDFIRNFGFIRSVDESGLVSYFFLHRAKVQAGIIQIGCPVLFHPGEPTKSGVAPPAVNVECGPHPSATARSSNTSSEVI